MHNIYIYIYIYILGTGGGGRYETVSHVRTDFFIMIQLHTPYTKSLVTSRIHTISLQTIFKTKDSVQINPRKVSLFESD